MDKTELKKWIILIIIASLCLWTVNNFEIIGNIISLIINVLLPFIIGGVLAFILNLPMKKIEKLLKKIFKKEKHKKLVRTISIVLSLLFLVLILLFVAFLLIPELADNIKLLIDNLPTLMDKAENRIVSLLEKYPDVQSEILDFFEKNDDINSIIGNILNAILNGAINIITSLISSTIALFTGIIFAIYMLSQKEYLINGSKKVIYAYADKKKARKIIKVCKLANKTFSKFISGQCVDAIILGTILFIVLSIFRFPYALIISVLTAITALVPIFGALIAMAVGALLIAITNPLQALLFIVVFQVVQQIEGNFIYPKVVGASVGLSPMWTLLAITAGGSLFGLVGMLIGLPMASIIYALFKENTNNRLKKKNLNTI